MDATITTRLLILVTIFVNLELFIFVSLFFFSSHHASALERISYVSIGFSMPHNQLQRTQATTWGLIRRILP